MNSLTELPSERQCHKQLFKIVWGNFTCPYCERKILLRDRYVWCGKCRKKHSVRAQTWLRGSKLPFQKIWLVIWCWQRKRGIGATKDITGITYPTIRKWFRKLRECLPRTNRCKLSGIIEIDESFFGRRKYGRQTIVAGAIERSSRRLRMEIIPDQKRATLEEFVLRNAEPSSTIATDYLQSYDELFLYGYTHKRHNHAIGHFSGTNQIESMWSAIKRHLRTLYGSLSFSAEDLRLILIEWENRQNNPELFYNVDGYLKGLGCSL